jgi:hypothetical protein
MRQVTLQRFVIVDVCIHDMHPDCSCVTRVLINYQNKFSDHTPCSIPSVSPGVPRKSACPTTTAQGQGTARAASRRSMYQAVYDAKQLKDCDSRCQFKRASESVSLKGYEYRAETCCNTSTCTCTLQTRYRLTHHKLHSTAHGHMLDCSPVVRWSLCACEFNLQTEQQKVRTSCARFEHD